MSNDKLLEWTIAKAKTEYADDVCIMMEKNDNYLERDRELRFVNKFVSGSKELIGLARTFIIGGVGYDLMQYSWENMERHAEVDYYCCVLADSTLVYYKAEEDKERFYALQKRFHDNLADTNFMYKRALEWLREAMELYKNLMFEDSLSSVRKAAGYIADYLSWSVAACNQTYFKLWVISQLEDLKKMPRLPEGFLECYNAIITAVSAEEIKELAHTMISATRAFIKEQKVDKPSPKSTEYWLKPWYEECSYYFRRIYDYCEQGNAAVAFSLSCGLQADLDDIAKEYGLAALDVLTNFDAAGLTHYADAVHSAEKTIVSAIQAAGYKIESYNTVEEFLLKNP